MSFKEKYYRRTQLGFGSGGSCYLAVCKRTGKQVAWKAYFQRHKEEGDECHPKVPSFAHYFFGQA